MTSAPRRSVSRARLPPPPPSATAVELEIPFHHVDVLGIAWHGHYPKYLDLARTALLRARRLDMEDLRALGFRFVVSESFLHHASPLRYGDRVRVTAWLGEVENRIDIAYQLGNLTSGAMAAEGWTAFVTTRTDGTLCLETPPEILERLRGP
jgi:acyl-CoA thioester hydrolase